MTTQERDIYYKILQDYKRIKEELRCIKCNGGSSNVFSNGLYEDGGEVKLGINPLNPLQGLITENTQIIATDLSPKTQTVTLSPTGGISLASRDTEKQSGLTITPDFINLIVDETGVANNTIEMYAGYTSVGARLDYIDNFSLNYTDRSLIDKGYLDNRLPTNPPVYADNAAAITGGLAVGAIYRKADGTLMVTY